MSSKPPVYELTNAADDDLTDICLFSYTHFGEIQADAFLDSIESCLTRLAESPRQGHRVIFNSTNYRRFIHGSHAIYYREINEGIRVIRILGPGRSTALILS